MLLLLEFMYFIFFKKFKLFLTYRGTKSFYGKLFLSNIFFRFFQNAPNFLPLKRLSIKFLVSFLENVFVIVKEKNVLNIPGYSWFLLQFWPTDHTASKMLHHTDYRNYSNLTGGKNNYFHRHAKRIGRKYIIKL